jgi:hypothetical protein
LVFGIKIPIFAYKGIKDMSKETLEISVSVQENFDMSFRQVEDGLDFLLSILVITFAKDQKA